MPQTKAAEKALRQTKRRTARNQKVRNEIDFILRNFKKALVAKDKAKADEMTKRFIKTIDKAAKRHIVHKNAAARKKSRLMKKVNALKK